MADAEARIGVVFPYLTDAYHAIDHAFGAEFADAPDAFDLSGGLPLAQQPVWQGADALLEHLLRPAEEALEAPARTPFLELPQDLGDLLPKSPGWADGRRPFAHWVGAFGDILRRARWGAKAGSRQFPGPHEHPGPPRSIPRIRPESRHRRRPRPADLAGPAGHPDLRAPTATGADSGAGLSRDHGHDVHPSVGGGPVGLGVAAGPIAQSAHSPADAAGGRRPPPRPRQRNASSPNSGWPIGATPAGPSSPVGPRRMRTGSRNAVP